MATEEELKAAMALDAQENESSGDENMDDTEEQTETLVAGRSKRTTAGNRMSSMVAEIAADDDLELLFAEDDEPDEEFEELSEGGGSDNDLGESSDDDDQGPTAGADDMDGEKEIEKQAQEERKRKRKAQQAFTRPSKKIKHVPIPGASMAAPAKKPKNKKVERLSWMPAPGEAIRSSRRAATTQQSEQLKSRILEREEERKLLATKLEAAAKKREEARAKVMTQEEHLAEAAQVEKENSKSLNRWEKVERQRQEEQRARLAALQNRQLEGPVVSQWSGPARWLGEKLSATGITRIKDVVAKEIVDAEKRKADGEERARKEEKKRQKEAERKAAGIVDTPMEDVPPIPVDGATNSLPDQTDAFAATLGALSQIDSMIGPSDSAVQFKEAESVVPGLSIPRSHSTSFVTRPKSSGSGSEAVRDAGSAEHQALSVSPQPPQQDTSAAPSIDHTPSVGTEDASKGTTPVPAPVIKQEPNNEFFTNTPVSKTPATPHPTLQPLRPAMPQQIVFSVEPSSSSMQAPNGATTTPASQKATLKVSGLVKGSQAETPAVPLGPPPEPEIAARNLVSILNVDFGGRGETSALDPLPKELRNSVLLSKTSKPKRTAAKATALCPITGLPVKYQDPVTGVGYNNSYAFKQLQAVADGRVRWSELAGCYLSVGLPKPAQGVPEGFGKLPTKVGEPGEK